MRHKTISVAAAGLLLAFGSAFAQAPAPGGPAGGASQLQLVRPEGVGGCVYRNLPESVSRDALMAVMAHTDLKSVLRGPLAEAAPRCTGRPFADSDGAVIASILSVYSRMVAASTMGRQLQIPQRELDAAWRAASASEKEPFIVSARTFVSPGAVFVAAKPEAAKPFVDRLALGSNSDPNVPKLVYMYYSATAMNEVAEADLASQAAQRTGR